MTLWKRFLAWGSYPLIVFGSLAVLLVGIEHAWLPASQLTFLLVLAMGLGIIVLEALIPDRPQQASWRVIWVDLLHNVFSSGGTSAVVRATAFAGLVGLGGYLSVAVGRGLWPTNWPLLAQIALSLVVGEFGVYWAHRLMHAYSALWRIHALHHSPPHLYLLASARSHPFNAILVHSLQVGPVVFLGAGPEVIAATALVTASTGLLQHANVVMHTEWLNWLFATPDLHRTHHSVELEESNTNYGNNLILWDLVFGTRLTGHRPAEYGVTGVAWPETYLGQLATPFTYDRLCAEAEAQSAVPEPGPRSLAPV